ncbi:MAG: glycosyltransferase family 39 protein [Burkholderiales bacterium]|nr:glycosyltransferase family 39 protein [Burkholderiales bacterium]
MTSTLSFDLTRGRLAKAALVLLALLLLTRLGHLTGPIDDPHSWRQADTAQYADSFYRHGVDLLQPRVNWMGPSATLAFEFPLPEAVMAWAYHAFGHDLMYARLVTLLCFAGAAWYLFLIVRRFSNDAFALLSAAIYLFLPLSLYYSRAVHVDFAAVFFAHAMCYHMLRFADAAGVGDALAAALAAVLAFLIKAPYVFYFALPIALHTWHAGQVRRLLLLALIGAPGVLGFLWWRQYSDAVNGAVPDWSFIPGYRKMVDMSAWYFGPASMRTDPAVWARLWSRLTHEVATKAGFWIGVFGAAAACLPRLNAHRPALRLLYAWLFGVAIYVLVFLNLNFIHDYYQMPLLAVCAVFIALGVAAPLWLFPASRMRQARASAAFLGVVVVFSCWLFANKYGYKADLPREEAGRYAAAILPADTLVVAATNVDYTDCRDPRLLYRLGHEGWSLALADVNPGLIARLHALGARYLVILRTDDQPGPDSRLGTLMVSHALTDGRHHVDVLGL